MSSSAIFNRITRKQINPKGKFMSSLSTTSLVLLLGTGLLAGCSVKPDLIGTDEMSAFVSSNAEQLVSDQEAVAGAIGFVGLIVPHLIRPFTDRSPSAILLPSAIGPKQSTLPRTVHTNNFA